MSTATETEPQQSAVASKEQRKVMRRTFVLKGFIRRAKNGSFEGICLTLNLAVRGRSIEDTEQRLFELIVAYLEDAKRSGTWEKLVPRHAPAFYYLEYYRLRFLSHFRSLVDFKLFVRSAPDDCMAHA